MSRVHAQHDGLDAMADALLAEHAGALHLVGASMGGMVALHAALRAPQRVASLALLGTTARADTPELIRLRSEACALFEQGRVDEVLRANVAFAFHPDHQRNESLIGGYLAMIRRAGAAQLVRQNRAVMARPDLRPRLPGLSCPTLVAVGEADALTPPACAEEIAAAIPGARLHTVGGAGHMLTLEQPEAVTHLLLDWLHR
ncbi:MAG: alpha/beta fold hydrolase [Rubrivivax sp.]